MKSKFIFLAYVLLSTNVYAQNIDPTIVGRNPCSQELYVRGKSYFKWPANSFEEFVTIYLKSEYGINIATYSKAFGKQMMNRIENEYCYKDRDVFSGNLLDDRIEVSINYGVDKYSFSYDTLYHHNDFVLTQIVLDSLGDDYIGMPNIQSTNKSSVIDDITLKFGGDSTSLNHELLQKAINPNRFVEYLGLTKPQVFYYDASNTLLVYIFGALDFNESTYSPTFYSIGNTYLLRIEIDISELRLISVVYLPGFLLRNYGWLECRDPNVSWLY